MKRKIALVLVMVLGIFLLASCGNDENQENTENDIGLVYEKSLELDYAENFSVDYYEGGYRMLTIMDKQKFLVVPENMEVPKHLDKDVVVLQEPMHNLYLVASATMDMFASLDAIDTIRLSGQKTENWYVPKAREAMEKGDVIYAGKYSQPDYELLVSEKCTLAIENTMIEHTPEVIEKLKEVGIPVLIEYSSYESHPLARVEWVKFFGALVGKDQEALEIFNKQIDIVNEVTALEKTDKTVAFFFVTSNGLIKVRQSNDYVPKMIEIAGGKYIFPDLGEPDSMRSTVNMQVETFYHDAKNVDYIIYNSSIDGGVKSIDELLEKCEVLKNFPAVKEGRVWCTTNDMFQQSMSAGYLIKDINLMLQGKTEGMQYLFQLK